MLVEKAAWKMNSAQPYVGDVQKVRRRDGSFLSMSPEMKGICIVVGMIVLCVIMLLFMQSMKARTGYEVVRRQQEVVQLTKANDELNLEVAELKSPTRIQKIAQDKLGMVLPDAFVYNSKGTTVERDVQVTKRIVD